MWKNINVNIQNIEINTGKSTLIKMPNKSNYYNYKFWHPSKLIKYGKNDYSVSVVYNDKFTFKLKKFGNGKQNKFDVIDEIEISVEEFEEAFEVMNDNIQYKTSNIEIEHHIPKIKKINKVEVVNELKY